LSGIAFVNSMLRGMTRLNPLVRMIRQAGLKKRVGEILLYVPLLGIGGYVGVVAFGGPPMAGLGAGVVAGAIPLMMVRRMQRKRKQLFTEQLPDALDLIRAALQAGHSLSSALYVVADEFPDPIAPEFRDKVFQLYFTTKERGSGIGLAMTFRAVQMHNGTIDFSNDRERGATFQMRFPLGSQPNNGTRQGSLA